MDNLAPSRPAWLWLARGLCLAALSISGYLLWMSGWDGSHVGGCGNEAAFGCEHVLASHWSRWLGLPVSLPGAVVYGAALLTLVAVGPRCSERVQRHAWKLLLLLAVTMVGAACWFIGLQALELRSFCPFCLGAHICGLLAAALIFWHSPIRWRGQAFDAPETPRIRPGTAALLVLVGLVAPGAFVAGQLRPGTADMGVKVEQQTVDKSKALPQRLVGELFDYTCEHCRLLHREMKKAQKRYGDQLSVMLFPMAMCASCNRFVQKTEPGHEQACDYARLALAVKGLDPAAFARLHEWLMEPAEVPPLAAAHTYAAGLVGVDALDKAVASPQVEEELQKIVRVYGASGQGKLPKLVAGLTIISGAPSGEQLFQLLEQHAGLVPPNR